MKRISKNNFLRIGVVALAVMALVSCGGGGGGDPGASNVTAAASRYTVELATSGTVLLVGNNITATINLLNNCVARVSTVTSNTGVSVTTTTPPIVSNCGNLPLDTVAGKEVTLSFSNPAAVTFSPSTVITDATGKALVTISAASATVSGVVQITASATLSGNTYSASPVSVAVN